jgi:hypothetical protein
MISAFTPTFSQDLHKLAAQLGNRATPLRDVLAATQGRGFSLMLFLVSLPFVTPIPLPGLSMPFGSLVLLVGTRLALDQKPWLPRWILDRQIPPRFLGTVLNAARRTVRCMELLLRPRMAYVHDQPVVRRLCGIMIMISGALLLLPLPIPFTNGLPALTVVLLTASAMERDGLCLLAGVGTFACTLGYFGLLVFGGSRLLDWLSHAFNFT